MRVSKEFIQAWRAWRHSSSPYSNAYLLHQPVTTGKVEHDHDHMESYLYSIGLAAIQGKDYEYAEIASQELPDLNRISAELECCAIAESEKELFRKHIKIVGALWQELEMLGSSGDTIQQRDAADIHQ